jgi:HlyD family secretion protein
LPGEITEYGFDMNYETSITGIQSASSQPAFDGQPLDSADSPGRRRPLVIAIIVAASLMLAMLGYYFYGKSPSDGAAAVGADEVAAQSVTVVAPGSETVARTINATGTIAARRDTPVGVVGEGGQVSRVFADAGDWVEQGQTLVSIERSVQVQQALALDAQIGVARADLQLAESELSRALQLVGRGFISKADVDRKTSARNAARARVGVAQAQAGEARARTAKLDIRAPVSGYVLERKVEPGQTVSAGSGILFRIARDGQMELQALLSENDLASVSRGVAAEVTPAGSAQTFTGQIWQVAPTIDGQSRQGIARVALPFDRALRPGGFANVVIRSGAMTAPILPESAIQNDKNGSFVYLIGADNKVVRREVKTGEVTATGIPVLQGLDGNERVVLFAGAFLNVGEKVKPVIQKKLAQ